VGTLFVAALPLQFLVLVLAMYAQLRYRPYLVIRGRCANSCGGDCNTGPNVVRRGCRMCCRGANNRIEVLMMVAEGLLLIAGFANAVVGGGGGSSGGRAAGLAQNASTDDGASPNESANLVDVTVQHSVIPLFEWLGALIFLTGLVMVVYELWAWVRMMLLQKEEGEEEKDDGSDLDNARGVTREETDDTAAALFDAAARGREEDVVRVRRAILGGFDPNTKVRTRSLNAESEFTLLIVASMLGNTEIVLAILETGGPDLDIEYENSVGFTALGLAQSNQHEVSELVPDAPTRRIEEGEGETGRCRIG
jgi:hypothetical protein